MGNVNKAKLDEKVKVSGWSRLRQAHDISSRFKQMGNDINFNDYTSSF